MKKLTTTIKDVNYQVTRPTRLKARGDVTHPGVDNPALRIRANLKGEELLEVIIHEVAHAVLWDIDEEAIDQLGRDAASLAHALGFREVVDE